MRMDRRQALRLLAAAGAAGAASACAGSPDEEPAQQDFEAPVTIGMLVPGGGGYQSIGDEIRNGFDHYLATAGNRLGGHPVTVIVGDEGESPEQTQEALDQLRGSSPHAIVGVATSTALMAVSETVEEAHLPLLATNGSPRGLQGVTYIWRTSHIDDEPALALGSYLARQVTGPVAQIVPDDTTGNDVIIGLRESFAASQQEGLLLPPIRTPPVSQPDQAFFAAAMQQVQAVAPQAVVCSYAGAAAIEFVRQYRAAGLNPTRLYAPGFLTEGAALAELGNAAAGITTASNYAAELRTPANRSFAADYRASFDAAPTSYAVAAYDAAAALDQAIGLIGNENLNARQVNVMLSRIGLIDSPRGLWQFNQNRTPTQKWYLRKVAPDGPVLANVVVKDLGTQG